MNELDCDQVVAFNDLRQYVIQVGTVRALREPVPARVIPHHLTSLMLCVSLAVAGRRAESSARVDRYAHRRPYRTSTVCS
jgi:hypothetical protein